MPQTKEGPGIARESPEGTTKLMRRLSCKDRLRMFWLFILGRRRLYRDLIGTFQYLKEPIGKPQMDLLSGAIVIGHGIIGTN